MAYKMKEVPDDVAPKKKGVGLRFQEMAEEVPAASREVDSRRKLAAATYKSRAAGEGKKMRRSETRSQAAAATESSLKGHAYQSNWQDRARAQGASKSFGMEKVAKQARSSVEGHRGGTGTEAVIKSVDVTV